MIEGRLSLYTPWHTFASCSTVTQGNMLRGGQNTGRYEISLELWHSDRFNAVLASLEVG